MSGRRLKQLLLQSAELDEVAEVGLAKQQQQKGEKYNVLRKKIMVEGNNDDKDEGENEKKLKSQLESILYFDNAFRERNGNMSMKRRMNELSDESKRRKKIRSNDSMYGTTSNSRSSSSSNARRKHEPTFDKKKDAERKRIQSLKDLARKMKKRRTKKSK